MFSGSTHGLWPGSRQEQSQSMAERLLNRQLQLPVAVTVGVLVQDLQRGDQTL